VSSIYSFAANKTFTFAKYCAKELREGMGRFSVSPIEYARFMEQCQQQVCKIDPLTNRTGLQMQGQNGLMFLHSPIERIIFLVTNSLEDRLTVFLARYIGHL
jgi:hypothetical protein